MAIALVESLQIRVASLSLVRRHELGERIRIRYLAARSDLIQDRGHSVHCRAAHIADPLDVVGSGFVRGKGHLAIRLAKEPQCQRVPRTLAIVIVREPGVHTHLGIQLVIVRVGLDHQRIRRDDLDTTEGRHEGVIVRHHDFVIVWAFGLGTVERQDHVHDDVRRGEGATIVPLDLLIQVRGIVRHALASDLLGLGVDLSRRQEASGCSVPIRPGIIGNHDLRLKGQ